MAWHRCRILAIGLIAIAAAGCGREDSSRPLMVEPEHAHYHVHAVDASHGHSHSDGEPVGHAHWHEHAPPAATN